MPEAAPAEAPQPSGPDLAGLSAAVTSFQQEQNGQQPETKPAPEQKQETPAAKESPSGATPKKPWEAKIAEPADDELESPPAESKPVEEAAPKGLKPEAAIRWGVLRKIEDEHKVIKPEYEKLKKEVEELRSKPPQAPPEVEAELNELRQFRAAYDVENTPEFQEAVLAPMQKQMDRLQQVAEYAQIDFDALVKATDEPNALKRGKAIRNLLASSSEEVDETAVHEALSAAEQLHPIYEKGNELKSKALEIKAALNGREKVQTEAQKAEQQQKLKAAAQELHGTLAANFKGLGLFEDAAVSKTILEASPADVKEDPQMAVYQAQAGALLPMFMEKFNAVQTELNTLKKQGKARNAAAPGLSARTEAPPAMSEDVATSLGQAVRASGFGAG